MNEEKGKIEYHYGFYAAVQFEYERVRSSFTFLQEHQLGKEPVQMDMLIIKRRPNTLNDAIGRLFRTYNVIEYKSPEDGLSIDDFYKVQGYACFYKSIDKAVNEVPIEELTAFIFRHTYPREMFAALERTGFHVERSHAGIYCVTGALCVPAQIIVTSQLPDGEYEAFKILAKNAKKEDVVKFIQVAYQCKSEHTNAILRVSMAANKNLYQILREEGPMEDVFEEIFHDKLDARERRGRQEGWQEGRREGREEGRQEGRQEGRYEGRYEERQIITNKLISAGWTPQDAATFTGLTN